MAAGFFQAFVGRWKMPMRKGGCFEVVAVCWGGERTGDVQPPGTEWRTLHQTLLIESGKEKAQPNKAYVIASEVVFGFFLSSINSLAFHLASWRRRVPFLD